MPKPWRYHDEARQLDEALMEDFKAAEAVESPSAPELPVDDGLRRVIDGNTACQEIDDIKVAAEAMAPELIREHSARVAIREKIAERNTALDAFINDLKK